MVDTGDSGENQPPVVMTEGGKSLIRIESVGNRFDEWYQAICPCGWKSSALGATDVGQAKSQHHRSHLGRKQPDA